MDTKRNKTRVSLIIKSLIEKKYIKSTLIYKEGTKQILKRVLKISYRPYLRKVKDPPQGKLKDNNIINNTSNNISNKDTKEKKKNYVVELEEIKNSWNTIAAKYNLSQIKSMSTSRKTKIKLRIKDFSLSMSTSRKTKIKLRIKDFSLAEIKEAIEKIKYSSFLQGKNGSNWRITFDWLITNDSNILKILEDNYTDKGTNSDEPTDEELEENIKKWKAEQEDATCYIS